MLEGERESLELGPGVPAVMSTNQQSSQKGSGENYDCSLPKYGMKVFLENLKQDSNK